MEEFNYLPQTGQETVVLRDLKSGARYSLKQDLGSGAGGCSPDTAGVAAACFAVESAIEEGCDLVVLSKFGRLEAGRGGLIDAFYAAIAAGTPILTSVAPSATQVWYEVAGPLAILVKPDYGAVESWRQTLVRAKAVAAG